MNQNELSIRLTAYVPQQAADVLAAWIIENRVNFRITRPRNSVYGDYMPPVKHTSHRISVNGDQNKFSFLLTAVHEFAHLEAWELYRERIKPHGAEWKMIFRKRMQPFFQDKIFPADVQEAILRYLQNPAASSCSDENLVRILKQYDRVARPFLQDLPDGEIFILNGRRYIKGPLRRTRYECVLAGTRQVFLISATAAVDVAGILPGKERTVQH